MIAPVTPLTLKLNVYRRERLVGTLTLTDSIIRVGTDPRSQIHLEDSTASRTHAIIEMREDEGPTLIDLGSAVGTWVNGARVNRCRLREGDQVRIGATEIQVERVSS